MTLDKIMLDGMVFYGYHGVSEEEKSQGQRFIIDVALTTDLTKAGHTDDLKDTIDYSQVYEMVKEVLEGPKQNLIESLADTIASRILNSYQIEEVMVIVRKPEVPIKGSVLASAGVKIVRSAIRESRRQIL